MSLLGNTKDVWQSKTQAQLDVWSLNRDAKEQVIITGRCV